MDGLPNAVFKPVYHSFKFKGTEAVKGLNVEDNSSLIDNNMFISNLKSQDSEVVPNPQPDDSWNMHAVRNASRASGNGHISQNTCTYNDKDGSRERKIAMDYDLPELVAFLQDSSNYQFFKDICIDKVVTCQDKCLEEKCESDHNRISCMLDSDPDSDSESIVETLDSESSFSTEDDCEMDVGKQCGSNNLKNESEKYFGERDDLSIYHSTKETISETLLVRQDPSKAVLANTMVLSCRTQAIRDNSGTSKASVKTDLENASINGREEVPQSTKFHPPEIGYMSGPDSSEDGTSSDSLTESSPRQSSASEPPSGPEFSGTIPSFGNISLRSNSSTASSQSFAFPIFKLLRDHQIILGMDWQPGKNGGS